MSDKMTREQARNILRNAAWLGTDEERELIEKAVELLCGEPCEDAISRQSVLDMMQMRMSAKELFKAVYELPSVNPKQKVGKWIYHMETWPTSWYRCSICGGEEERTSNYCPNCGANMVEPQERSE